MTFYFHTTRIQPKKSALISIIRAFRTTLATPRSVACVNVPWKKTSTPKLTTRGANPVFCACSTRLFCTSNEDPPQDKEGSDNTEKSKTLIDRKIVAQRVIDVVKNFEKVDSSKVSESSHFVKDLGLDSLDVVEVVMAFEQEFVIDIPDHDAEKIQSVSEAIDYIAANPSAK